MQGLIPAVKALAERVWGRPVSPAEASAMAAQVERSSAAIRAPAPLPGEEAEAADVSLFEVETSLFDRILLEERI